MDPIPGVVGKKAADWLFDATRKWWNRRRDLEKRIEGVEAQLAEERSGRLAFERLMSELVCRPEDDSMYWRKDGSGGPYCPLCLHENKKLIPLTHSVREGEYYCRLHDHPF